MRAGLDLGGRPVQLEHLRILRWERFSVRVTRNVLAKLLLQIQNLLLWEDIANNRNATLLMLGAELRACGVDVFEVYLRNDFGFLLADQRDFLAQRGEETVPGCVQGFFVAGYEMSPSRFDCVDVAALRMVFLYGVALLTRRQPARQV
jgi:hypothetical protein